MKKGKKDFFWVSFSDLMTSLFFVMLVLFVLVYALQSSMIKELDAKNKELNAAKIELDMIKKVKKALQNLDPKYFTYSEEYKKHILNIPDALFKTNSSNMMDMSPQTRGDIRDAGNSLEKLMRSLPTRENVRYLIVIEGQASKDNYTGNDQISYKRAIALRNFWFGLNPNLNNVLPNCEVVIAGSGQYGIPRIEPDIPPANQRFLITIVPKIGDFQIKESTK
jgi:hypothetical protein